MGYEIALNKAWDELLALSPGKNQEVKFLADTYSVDLAQKNVLSLACNVAAKDFTTILILHYLAHKIKGFPQPTGEWLPFRKLSGIEGYYSAFRARSIEPIIRKYGTNPTSLLKVLERLPAKEAKHGDVAVVLETFPEIPVLISLWRADEEFAPEANVFFDKTVTQIFCIEDIVVLAGIVAAAI